MFTLLEALIIFGISILGVVFSLIVKSFIQNIYVAYVVLTIIGILFIAIPYFIVN